jgi:TonB family protein
MNRLLIVKICALIILYPEVAPAQSRTLLAEGDYVALAKSGAKPLSHWKLWHLDDGKYEVIDSNTRNPAAIQVFRFDSKFMPIGFSRKTGPLDLPDSRLPKFPASEISCDYKAKELSCETISGDGTRSRQTAAAVPPYVVVGEFYDLDFAWFMTGVVHLASSGVASDGFVNVYAMTTGSSPTQITLRPDKPIQIISDVDESALALGRTQRIRKYRVESDNGRILTGTEQGLIVRLSPASNTELGYAIDSYKEYQPWGVPFGNMSNVAAVSAAGKKSGTTGRLQVPSGVMIGLLIRRVQPEYPAAAKLDKIQGIVVLHAVINTEGKVSELSSISGPQELINSAMEAVKQWQYRPYVSQGQPVQVDTQITVNFTLPK